MFLTLTSTATPATDLGFLLHKHPYRVQRFELAMGAAHVFYPEAEPDRCTVALLLEVDPIGLVRGKRFAHSQDQYVNDRPYAASSLLSVAIGNVFRTALAGRCDARPELVGQPLPLELHLPAVPSTGGADLVRRLFEPLGWQVSAQVIALDPPAWGDSRYLDVRLSGTVTVADALSHLYVLLPVLDGGKHYWVNADEVDKLIRRGTNWLPDHPERDLILDRSLAHQRDHVQDAVERLNALDDSLPTPEPTPDSEAPPRPLTVLRREAVLQELKSVGAHRVVDVGCGEGALLRALLPDPWFTEILGTDVSMRELDRAERRLQLDRLPDAQRAKLTLRQSSLTYRDDALAGFDALVLMEVIEHVDIERLDALERNVFRAAAPSSVLVTTPNAEYNVRYPSLAANAFRHPDHRFEWTRTEFEHWAMSVGETYGYQVRFVAVGECDPELGSPTQLGVFTKEAAR